MACDLRFCAADAYLAITPAKLGLVYGHAETRRLVELVGPSRAKDLLFTGRRIETEEALAIGLIDRRVETALGETVLGYARGLAELSQASIRGAKRAVDGISAGMIYETPALSGAHGIRGARAGFRRGTRGLRGEAAAEILLSRPDGPAERIKSSGATPGSAPCRPLIVVVSCAMALKLMSARRWLAPRGNWRPAVDGFRRKDL